MTTRITRSKRGIKTDVRSAEWAPGGESKARRWHPWPVGGCGSAGKGAGRERPRYPFTDRQTATDRFVHVVTIACRYTPQFESAMRRGEAWALPELH